MYPELSCILILFWSLCQILESYFQDFPLLPTPYACPGPLLHSQRAQEVLAPGLNLCSDIDPPAPPPTRSPSLANLLTQLRAGLTPVKRGVNHLLQIQKQPHPKACYRGPLQAERRSVAVREDLSVPWMESDAMLGP